MVGDPKRVGDHKKKVRGGAVVRRKKKKVNGDGAVGSET